MLRFWFEFDFSLGDEYPPGVIIGCGITAHGIEDAFSILEDKVFKGKVPTPKAIEEDIDISLLDSGHVIPNMSNHFIRGVWFPLGYN